MFLLVIYALFLILPFASRNITYRTATLFAAMTLVINTASICARLFLPLPYLLDPEALAYYIWLFLPVFLGCSLVIGATILPIATLRSTSYLKRAAVVLVSTVAFFYLSYVASRLAGDLLFGVRLRPLEYYFTLNFQRIASVHWDYIHLAANSALAASATIIIVQRWSRQL